MTGELGLLWMSLNRMRSLEISSMMGRSEANALAELGMHVQYAHVAVGVVVEFALVAVGVRVIVDANVIVHVTVDVEIVVDTHVIAIDAGAVHTIKKQKKSLSKIHSISLTLRPQAEYLYPKTMSQRI